MAAPVRSSGFLYENRELLKWLLNPDLLRKMIPWWDSFERQQAEIRHFYLNVGKRSPFTGTHNISRAGLFFHQARIPINIAEIISACDYELADGRNQQKFEAFLKDHPVFDLRVTSR